MPPITRLGDIALGHGSFPPTAVIEGSTDTISNNKPTHRMGDAIAPHGSPSPSPPHPRMSACGSPNTLVNNKPVVRIGDCVACGGLLASGSSNIIVN